MSSQELAEAEERLGADISTGNSSDRSLATLSALSANLAPSLDILTDVVRNPAFQPSEIERIKAQTLTGIAQTQKDPTRVANRVLPAVLFGAANPYGGPAGGGPQGIARFSPPPLARYEKTRVPPPNPKKFSAFSP